MKGNLFSIAQGLYPRRRAYNMSYRNDYTACLGQLVPVYWQNLIPNTSWHVIVHALIRTNPMLSPIMDNIDFYVHFWQAPERILKGDQFTKFITGELPMEEYENIYFVPQLVSELLSDLLLEYYTEQGADDPDGMTEAAHAYLLGNGSLMDMLGYDALLFQNGGSDRKIQCNKLLMYVQLLVHWYVNENVLPWESFLEDSEWATDPATNQGDLSSAIANWLYYLLLNMDSNFFNHRWPQDYYTSALPTLQYGGPTYLPLGDSAPVVINQGTAIKVGSIELAVPGVQTGSNYTTEIVGSEDGKGTVGAIVSNQRVPATGAETQVAQDVTLQADLSAATAITVNELRVANALQVFKEREMRYGRRAPEYYKGFYGVRPDDLRLQLPKFLGGGKMPINISDIEQTSQTADQQTPLGTLAGKGTGVAGGFASASAFASEETLILGLAWAMPKITYAQQLSRHDTKINDRFEYFNPSFVHIGEQEVRNYEIYASGDDKEFGYQPRYTEYRFHSNEMHGQFKDSLSFWTLGRIFDSQPALNAAFIYMQPRALSRIFAVQADSNGFVYPNMLVSMKFNVSLVQPLSKYGTPSLIV